MHPAALPAAALLAECDERRTRRGGPGGQHRNKVETAVVLVHRPTGLTGRASERRSQAANRRMALRRLRLEMAINHRCAVDATGPSARWRRRVSAGRIAVATDHDDYPALVAEALDRLHACGWDSPPAAAALGVTPSQLVRLLRRDPAAWTALCRHRTAVGRPPLS